MSESKHTPGPWRTHAGYPTRVLAPPHGEISPTVAESASSLIPKDEREANARLIAAAPELLEAIENEAARRAYDAGLGVSEWEAFLWPEARAAITKAVGG